MKGADRSLYTKSEGFCHCEALWAVAISCNVLRCAAVRGDCHVTAFGAAPRNDSTLSLVRYNCSINRNLPVKAAISQSMKGIYQWLMMEAELSPLM